jgi:hypothetical protein
MRFDDPTAPQVASQQATHTVIEKGMSPAEAVKLLAEFEKAARDKIIGAIHVENQLLNGEVLIERDAVSRRNRLVLKLKLNGRERLIEVSVDDWHSPQSSTERLESFRAELANRMVEVMLDELTATIFAAIQPRNF